MRKPNLVIVEDDPAQRHLYRAICQRFDYNGTILTCCRDILEMLESDGAGIDMLLLDWSLKGESGLDCIHKIRSICNHKGRRRLPIIIVTAHAMTGDREVCLAQGADDYLSKPFTLNEFSSMVTKWLSPPSTYIDYADRTSDDGAQSRQAMSDPGSNPDPRQ